MQNHCNSRLLFFSIPAFFCFLTSCVSVDLGPKKGQQAEALKFDEPVVPFRKKKIEGFDRAWQSERTGNTMGFLSECQGSDVNLDQMANDALTNLQSMQIKKQTELEFNGREAREYIADGKMDGVPVRMGFLIFKKNGCSYTLSFVGSQKRFDSEYDHFNRFQKSFITP